MGGGKGRSFLVPPLPWKAGRESCIGSGRELGKDVRLGQSELIMATKEPIGFSEGGMRRGRGG